MSELKNVSIELLDIKWRIIKGQPLQRRPYFYILTLYYVSIYSLIDSRVLRGFKQLSSYRAAALNNQMINCFELLSLCFYVQLLLTKSPPVTCGLRLAAAERYRELKCYDVDSLSGAAVLCYHYVAWAKPMNMKTGGFIIASG